MLWSDLNSRQLADLDRDTVCILPTGAIEQHGPHLPVATDLMIANGIAQRLNEACGNKLLVMPSISVSCSDHHLAFAGTLSIEHGLFQSLILQITQSAARHGFRRFFLLNAHGGNIAAGGVVTEQLSRRLPDCEIVFATWFRAGCDQLRRLVEGEYRAVGDACGFGTSLIMALHPELVDRDSIEDGGVAPSSPLLRADLLKGGRTVQSFPFEKVTKNGVWGKPSLASKEKGEKLLVVVVTGLKELLSAHWPHAPGICAEVTTMTSVNGYWDSHPLDDRNATT